MTATAKRPTEGAGRALAALPSGRKVWGSAVKSSMFAWCGTEAAPDRRYSLKYAASSRGDAACEI